MIGFKGFNKDLKCRDKQYVIGETAEEPTAKLCEMGIHFCEYPLDVFGYYSPGEGSRYCEVESPDEDLSAKTETSDTKRVTKRLRIGLELSLPALVAAAIKFTFDRAIWTDTNNTSGNRSASQASGDQSASQASGNRSASQASGNRSASQASGNQSASQASGDQSASQASGNRSASQASGYQSASQASGDQSASQASGNRSASQASGNRSASQASGYQCMASVNGYSSSAKVAGEESIACALGRKCSASGDIGNWLVLVERDDDGIILGVQTVKVDGETIKANTFYTLSNGQIERCERNYQ